MAEETTKKNNDTILEFYNAIICDPEDKDNENRKEDAQELEKFLNKICDKNSFKYIPRKNLKDDNGAFFGYINIDEPDSSIYSDLSIVVFPSNETEKEKNRWIVSLGVGSGGYKNDLDIISLPGTRRAFLKDLKKINKKYKTYIKADFLDIDSSIGFDSFFKEELTEFKTLENAVKKYRKFLLAATIFDPNDIENSKNIILYYLALYAKHIRNWKLLTKYKKSCDFLAYIENYTDIFESKNNNKDEQETIKNLLESRRFIVLQGAPGTGKTRMAKKIAKENNGTVFFTQFHAETTYSDFIHGLMPKTNTTDHLEYELKEGFFVQAIREAQKDESKDVYLIIDEINRANLSNVLGEAFYLFEPNMKENNVKIKLSPGYGTDEKPELELSELPKNLYVIATMNTADRSLAIVDFALRRRFAWYTMKPHSIGEDKSKKIGDFEFLEFKEEFEEKEKKLLFCESEFNKISGIFEKYATDEELNLQPGHAYFIVEENDAENKMKDRLKYEIMPLIKEYLLDGMLSRAKDDFVNYFRDTIKEEMFA